MEFDEFLKQTLPPLGYSWRPHRRRAVRRKILERMQSLHFCSFEDYLYFLLESQKEKDKFNTFLPVTVSRFFRNHEYFDFLRNRIFPEIIYKKSHQNIGATSRLPVRVWSAGAAAGEEAYSIALVWDHWFSSHDSNMQIKILATDIDKGIIERGKKGLYERSSLKELPQELIDRYFQESQGRYQLAESIRSYVDWICHDFRKEPPLTHNDIVFCCYFAFTYFSKEVQKETVEKLADTVFPEGYLILGRKEELPRSGLEFFDPVDSRLHVYKRK